MNETQFREVYLKHESTVRAVLFRMCGPADLDDLVQECFIKVFQGIDGFKGESELRTWIYRIAINTANDYLRAKKRRSWLLFFGKDGDSEGNEASEVLAAKAGAVTSISEYERFEAKHDVARLLRKLSPKLRETVTLFSIDELSIDDISQILQVPSGTVKSRISLAKQELSKSLEGKKAQSEKSKRVE